MQGDTLSSAPTAMLSMHQCKGQEFDFVILVVEPREHSSKVSVDELKRLSTTCPPRALASGSACCTSPSVQGQS